MLDRWWISGKNGVKWLRNWFWFVKKSSWLRFFASVTVHVRALFIGSYTARTRLVIGGRDRGWGGVAEKCWSQPGIAENLVQAFYRTVGVRPGILVATRECPRCCRWCPGMAEVLPSWSGRLPRSLVQAFPRTHGVRRVLPRILVAAEEWSGCADGFRGRCRGCPMDLGSGSQIGLLGTDPGRGLGLGLLGSDFLGWTIRILFFLF